VDDDCDDSIIVDCVVGGVVKGIYNVVFVQGWGMGDESVCVIQDNDWNVVGTFTKRLVIII
jgi:hypothetical protein